MSRYRAIFFDLDHTLWDFDRNSEETLVELFHRHKISGYGIPHPGPFIETYRKINKQMWEQYHLKQIDKEHLRIRRFEMAFREMGIADRKLPEVFSEEYLAISPNKPHLMPGARELLEMLHPEFDLHIITNGFREVQQLKVHASGLEKYFSHIHISEVIGFLKPDPAIFHYAMQRANQPAGRCLMVGDNLDTDIRGASQAGLDAVWYNSNGSETVDASIRQVTHLSALTAHL